MRQPLLALMLAATAAVACAQASAPAGVPSSFAPALARAMPFAFGVYGFDTRRHGFAGADSAGQARHSLGACTGAGFFIDTKGLAVTAAHVIADCAQLAVKLADQRVVVAERVGVDEDVDIALIRVPIPPLTAPPLRAPALRPGDWVLAVGEPYALGASASAGIVGGKERHFAEESEVLFIQSDLALNPGNSGGPLLDVRGAIVGMNVRTVVGQLGTPGVSLSIPIDIVLQVAQELKAGAIQRPRLGAEFHDLAPDVAVARGRAYAHGALIELVRTDSLAERAGLKVGDIVVGMNGRAIGDSGDLTRALLAWRRAQGTRFTVYRSGAYRELAID